MSNYMKSLPTLPEHMRDAIVLWIERGILPGSFLTAVLENDLAAAYGRADEVNSAAMHAWVKYLYNDAPSACHGSREKVMKWEDRGGLIGHSEAAE